MDLYTVILDTNVLVSAGRSNVGASALLLKWLQDRRFAAVVSPALVLEYEEVLRREIEGTFLPAAEVTRMVDFMCAKSRHVQPVFLLRPTLLDPDNDFVLELAFTSGVDYVVTHNVRDFVRAAPFGINTIRPGDFVRLLRGET